MLELTKRRYQCQLECEKSKTVIKLVKKAIKNTEKELAEVEKAIDALLESNEKLDKKVKVLETIKGIGKKTATRLLAYCPELGQCNRAQTASLAGLAPIICESGTMKKRSMIRGGRADLRKTLYMPALGRVYPKN